MASNKRRRASYVVALAAAGALLLSACGGETTADPSASETAATTGDFPTTGSGVVNVYNWTDYIDPEELKRSPCACAEVPQEYRSWKTPV
jgi:spermidine/putrescine-binding protein